MQESHIPSEKEYRVKKWSSGKQGNNKRFPSHYFQSYTLIRHFITVK